MKCIIPTKDLDEDILYYDVDTNNENYIKWITRGEGGSFEDFSTGLYTKNNNNVATTSQENIFINENQNSDDILAVSAGYETYETNNIVNECYIPNQNSDIDKKLGELEATNKEIKEELNQYNKKIRSIEESINELNPLCKIESLDVAKYDNDEYNTNDIANEYHYPNQNIEIPPQQSTKCAENLSIEVNMDDAPEDIKNETYTDDYVRKRIKELKLQEDELEQLELLLQNEEQKLLGQLGPPDNMRNRKKNFNQFLKKDIGALNNIRNIKNNKTLEINEYGNGCFDISYT